MIPGLCTIALLVCGLANAQHSTVVADAALDSGMKPPPPVVASDYTRYTHAGHGAIYGHLDINSESAFGPSIAVYLLPGTTYTLWWVNHRIDESYAYEQGAEMDPVGTLLDPRVAQVVRKTYSDNHGQFAFIGLPSGWYALFAVSEDRPPPRVLRQGYTTTVISYTAHFTYDDWDEATATYTPHVDTQYVPPVIDSGEDFMLILGSDEFRVISGAPAREVPTKVFTTIDCGRSHGDICPGARRSSSSY